MDKPPRFVTFFLCFSCQGEGRDTDGYSAGYRVAERSQIILRREKCFVLYLPGLSVSDAAFYTLFDEHANFYLFKSKWLLKFIYSGSLL